MTSSAPPEPTLGPGRVPSHMAWVATGSDRWASATGASSLALAEAEDRALRTVVETAAAAGVRWLTVQEPTEGRGLRSMADALVRRGVRVAALDDAGALEPLSDGLTVLLTVRGRGRAAIVEAVQRLADDGVDPAAVDEKAIGARMDVPDVDLLVHTGGDRRVHNLLLWEVAYSELVVLEAPWPAIDASQVDLALAEYRRRDRRYGGIVAPGPRR